MMSVGLHKCVYVCELIEERLLRVRRYLSSDTQRVLLVLLGWFMRWEVNGRITVALCGWAARADDSFVCFGAKPDKGFLDMKSRRIRKWEGVANESWLDKGAEKQLTGDPDESSWRLDSRELAWNHGQGQSTPDSGDSRRQDRVQWRRSTQDVCIRGACGIFASNHASDSPHMHLVLQYLFSALG